MVHESDGNILQEIVAALQLVEDVPETNSYDPYTCKVRDSFFYECLDIASPRTLSSSINGSYGVGLSSTSFAWLGSVLDYSSLNHFGGATTCDEKITGDGAVNSFDVAVLMWYQFEMPPYNRAGLSRTPAEVTTVDGRHDTWKRCETNETRQSWQLTVADDYCALSENKSPSPARRLGKRAENALQVAAQPVNRRSLFEADAMADLGLQLCEWAVVPGAGRWVRIHVKTVLITLEFLLSGFATEQGIILSNQQIPPFNCTDCTPELTSPDEPVVTFARFLEYEGVSADRAATDCATIVGLTPGTALYKNVLSLRQQPAFQACRFDIFVWIPQQPGPGVHIASYAANGSFSATRLAQLGATTADGANNAPADCGDDFGVLAGSGAMDGRGGQVQREAACVQHCVVDLGLGGATTSPEPSPPPPPSPNSAELSSPPPPSPNSPEPSPPKLPPPPVVLTMTASGSVSDYTDTTALQSSIAAVAAVDASAVTVTVAAASVLITAIIEVPASTTPVTVQTTLSSSLGTAAAASAALGITVVSVPKIVVAAPPSPSPPPSPPSLPETDEDLSQRPPDSGDDGLPLGAIFGIAAGGACGVVGLAIFVMSRRGKNRVEPAYYYAYY